MPLPLLVAPILVSLGGVIARIFASRIGMWIVSGLVFLGLSWGSQKFAVGPILDQIKAVAAGASGDAVVWLGVLNVDKAITIILSAYTTRMGVNAAKVFLKRRAA